MPAEFSGKTAEQISQLVQAVTAIKAKMAVMQYVLALGMPLLVALVVFAITTTMSMQRSIGTLEGSFTAATAPIKQLSTDAQTAVAAFKQLSTDAHATIAALKDTSSASTQGATDLSKATTELKNAVALVRPPSDQFEEFSAIVQLAADTSEKNDRGFVAKFPLPDVLRGRKIREIRPLFRFVPPTFGNAGLVLSARPEGDTYSVQLFAAPEATQRVFDLISKQPMQIDVVFVLQQ